MKTPRETASLASQRAEHSAYDEEDKLVQEEETPSCLGEFSPAKNLACLDCEWRPRCLEHKSQMERIAAAVTHWQLHRANSPAHSWQPDYNAYPPIQEKPARKPRKPRAAKKEPPLPTEIDGEFPRRLDVA